MQEAAREDQEEGRISGAWTAAPVFRPFLEGTGCGHHPLGEGWIGAELAAAGADDVSLEIVSGVLVGIGFSVDVETVEQAGKRAEEVLWVSSLEHVGRFEIAVPSSV